MTTLVRPVDPLASQRAMVFIDGTNLFHRLRAAKLLLRGDTLGRICAMACGSRQRIRSYLYSSQHHLDAARDYHKADFLGGVSVQLGDTILTGSGGTPKEKAVDAMLVADLVYHAAVRNIDYAVLMSVDTDFVRAIKRVEDFGCRTAVVGICASVPPRLREATDDVIEYGESFLLQESIVNPDRNRPG